MFFFFKQKTAYEMRISDWSSDVCSSDLWLFQCGKAIACALRTVPCQHGTGRGHFFFWHQGKSRGSDGSFCAGGVSAAAESMMSGGYRALFSCVALPYLAEGRSEEHTSELQSLMRISYAVFCLQKK